MTLGELVPRGGTDDADRILGLFLEVGGRLPASISTRPRRRRCSR